MTIFEPSAESYEAEFRYDFRAESPAGPHVVVSGSVFTGGSLTGNLADSEDESDEEYEVRLLVGPFWRDLESVVPSVSFNGFYNSNSDDDDQQKWEIKDLTWDSVGEFGPNNDELRIRLKFTVLVRGQSSRVNRLAYYVFARGRQLGLGGINEPGPVKKQG